MALRVEGKLLPGALQRRPRSHPRCRDDTYDGTFQPPYPRPLAMSIETTLRDARAAHARRTPSPGTARKHPRRLTLHDARGVAVLAPEHRDRVARRSGTISSDPMMWWPKHFGRRTWP